MSSQIDPREFRHALSSFATGVTIVTARDAGGEPIGMTASSFNSVSMEPPLVLWSVNKNALSADAFKAAEHWAVHVLASDQIALSDQFATSGADKFGDLHWAPDKHGVPILENCATCFSCRAWAAYEGGDHWILVGEVIEIAREPREALIFASGSYAIADTVPTAPINESSVVADTDAGNDDAIEDLLMYQLSRATRQMSEQFHETVRRSGLSVAQWRVLASLHGPATRALPDLGIRTFLDMGSLVDLLHALQEQGLCTFDLNRDPPTASGTQAGHDRVSHLFEAGEKLELAALGDVSDDDAGKLKDFLRAIVRNTSV